MSAPVPINRLKAAMQGMAKATPQPTPLAAAPDAGAATGFRPTLAPSRRGKRVVSAYIEAAAAKQLRLLAVDNESSTQALLEEALNDLFRKYGRSAIA